MPLYLMDGRLTDGATESAEQRNTLIRGNYLQKGRELSSEPLGTTGPQAGPGIGGTGYH